MKRSITTILSLALLILALPQSSEAYIATKATALRLSDTTLMFLLTYEFGHEERTYHMPIAAVRGGEQEGSVGYSIWNGNLRTNIGDTTAIILSDAKVENGQYLIPVDESREFTLVTFLTLPKDTASSSRYSVSVGSLPFEIGKDGVYTESELHENELKDYRTPAIGTEKKIGITQKIN